MGVGNGRACLVIAAAACSSQGAARSLATDAGRDARDAVTDSAADAPHACTQPVMDLSSARTGFFDAPFPSDARVTATGIPDLSGFPVAGNTLATSVVALVQRDARAFGTTSSVYFRFTAPLATSGLVDPHASLAPGASIFLVDVDPASAAYGARLPTKALFSTDGGPFGASDLLAVLPYPGVALRPRTRYAAVVLRSQKDASGSPLCAAPAMAGIVAGTSPDLAAPVLAEYTAALAALGSVASPTIAPSDVAAMTVFTTDDPTRDFAAVTTAMRALPVPAAATPWAADEVFPTYCVFHSTIPMPEYQAGTPPYTNGGGGWVFDASGAPVLQRQETAAIVVTVPRTPMPVAGYPVVNMSRTGAGGNRPLVDRGQQALNGGPPIVPGTGPALYFAAAGFAGVSIDGPLGGLRNPVMPGTDANEDFTVFNIGNPEALRDNVRQSAAELALAASILAGLSFDASSCPGATVSGGGPVRFDPSKMAMMSHSMGSTIAPLTLAFEPRYRASILSGAGGSWIENIIFKQQPVAVMRAIELLLGIQPSSGYTLTEGDPMVNLFQWAAESADAPVYDRRTVRAPVDGPARSVLKVQGIIDHYILPPICNATSLSLGLDLAGPELDTSVATDGGLDGYPTLSSVLDLSGRKTLTLPAGGNVPMDGGAGTAIVTQHYADGIEDGHEVIFQTDAPKHEYICFLQALAAGQTPMIPPDGPALAPCP